MAQIELKVKNKVSIGQLKSGTKKIVPPLIDLEVTPVKEQQQFNHEGEYGYDKVTVKGIKLQDKVVTPTKEQQLVKADDEFSGLNQVNVNAIPESYVEPAGTLDIAENGIHDVKNYEKINADIHEPTPYAPRGISFYRYSGTNLQYELSNLDTSNMQTFDYMFSDSIITYLDLSNLKTNHIKSMKNLMSACSSLLEVNLDIDMTNVTDASLLAKSASKILSLKLANSEFSKVTTIQEAFNSCYALVDLDLSNLNAEKLTNINNAFLYSTNVENLNFMKNLGKGYTNKSSNYSMYKLNLNSQSKLSYESVLDVINKLYDLNLTYKVADGGTLYAQTIQLNANTKTLLSEEDIAILTSKGWNLA